MPQNWGSEGLSHQFLASGVHGHAAVVLQRVMKAPHH